MSGEKNFEHGELFDWSPSHEKLVHATPKTALKDLIDSLSDKDLGLKENIEKLAPLKIYAFAREIVTATWINDLAVSLAGKASEKWAERFGDPEGDSFNQNSYNSLIIDLEEALETAVRRNRVFHCHLCGEKSYSKEELLDLFCSDSPKEDEPEVKTCMKGRGKLVFHRKCHDGDFCTFETTSCGHVMIHCCNCNEGDGFLNSEFFSRVVSTDDTEESHD